MRVLFWFLITALPSLSLAQAKRLDLDDLMIKGELHSDDRMLILARQRNELKNFVRFRESYREEILQELPSKGTLRRFSPR